MLRWLTAVNLSPSMARRKIPVEGREIDGTDVAFEIIRDGHVRIKTEDGAVLRVRPVIVNVLRTDEKGPEGDPQYVVQSFVHVSVEAAKEGE